MDSVSGWFRLRYRSVATGFRLRYCPVATGFRLRYRSVATGLNDVEIKNRPRGTVLEGHQAKLISLYGMGNPPDPYTGSLLPHVDGIRLSVCGICTRLIPTFVQVRI